MKIVISAVILITLAKHLDMKFDELVIALKKNSLTGAEMEDVFGLMPPNVANVVRDVKHSTSRYYKYIDTENFRNKHGLNDSQINALVEIFPVK